MQTEHLFIIAGMAVVTYLPRALPLLLLSSRRLNPLIERWLAMVPSTVIAAILAQELFIQKNGDIVTFNFHWNNVFLLASLPAFLTAWFTRSFLGTVVVGMASVAALRLFF